MGIRGRLGRVQGGKKRRCDAQQLSALSRLDKLDQRLGLTALALGSLVITLPYLGSLKVPILQRSPAVRQ